MPHINAEAKTIAITGLSGYTLLCSSTVGLYIGQDGRIVKSDGSGSLKVQILDVPSSVGFVCKFMDSPGSATFADYNGGKVYFDNQVVLEPENRIIPGNTLELATADAPGAIASSLTTALTPTGNSLYVSAAERAKVQAALVGFRENMAALGAVYAPGATRVNGQKFGGLPYGILTLAAGLQVGGLSGGSLAAQSAISQLTLPIIRDPPNSQWWIAMDGVFPVTTGSAYATLYISNGTQHFGLTQEYSSYPTSYYLRGNVGGAGDKYPGGTATSARSTYMIAFDGTTLRALHNGAVIISSTDLTKLPILPSWIAIQSSVAGALDCAEIAWGTV